MAQTRTVSATSVDVANHDNGFVDESDIGADALAKRLEKPENCTCVVQESPERRFAFVWKYSRQCPVKPAEHSRLYSRSIAFVFEEGYTFGGMPAFGSVVIGP
jgi:hypothetical protein